MLFHFFPSRLHSVLQEYMVCMIPIFHRTKMDFDSLAGRIQAGNDPSLELSMAAWDILQIEHCEQIVQDALLGTEGKKMFQDVSIYFMTGTCIFHSAFVPIDELCSVSYQFWRVASSCAIMEHEPFQRSLDCFAKDRTLGAEGQDTCMFSWLVYNQSNGHWQLLALDWTTKNCIQLLYFWTYSLFQNHPRFTCWMLGAVFVYGNLFAWTPTWYCIDKLSSTIVR